MLFQLSYIARLQLHSYNSGHLTCNLNKHYVTSLIKILDILALSEHWLRTYNLYIHQLHSLDKDFCFLANSSPDGEDPIFRQPRFLRGNGGVAIAWHSKLTTSWKNSSPRLPQSVWHTSACWTKTDLFLLCLPTVPVWMHRYLQRNSGYPRCAIGHVRHNQRSHFSWGF